MIEINEFILNNVFNHIPATEDKAGAWWRECVEPQSGYIMLWEDGNSFHTYRCPEDWY